jgi:multimeric flavodoxin WrbA
MIKIKKEKQEQQEERNKGGHERLKAVMLVATLKRSPEISNTEMMCQYLAEHLKPYNVPSEIVRLIDFNILPGLKRNMGTHKGQSDEWPKILPKLLKADIIIFATPIWWGIASSLMQRVIERLDTENDTLLETGISPFANKVGGIVITGAEDGAQHIIGNLLNFMVWNGLTMTPACSLSRLGGLPETYKETKKLFDEKESDSTKLQAEVMARNLVHMAHLLKKDPFKDRRIKQSDISAGTVGIRH